MNPSDAELEILTILWQHAPCSVRFVHEQISQKKQVGYTTTLKQIQRMLDKNMVARSEDLDGTHLYTANLKENAVKKNVIDKVMESVFGGSAMKMVMHALGNNKSSKEEIAALKKWLDNQENEQK